MPSTITHSYFALDVLDKIDEKKKDFLKDSIPLLKVFAQSMDPIGFYDFLRPYKIKSYTTRKIAKISHRKKTGEFLVTMTEYIKESNYENNPSVIAFLYGLINHYVLDSTMHPYIIYKTGVFNPKDKKSYKYNATHHYMEQYLDNYMVQKKENIIPSKYKCYKDFIKIKNLDKELNNTINYSFKKVYAIEKFSKIYLKSIKDMHFAIKHLRYDPYGIMNSLYHIFDWMMPKIVLNAKFLSYKFKAKDIEKSLNNEHKKWYYSADKKIESTESFDDLYKKAIDKAVTMINKVNEYLYDNKKIDLKKVYGNLSYTTGLDLSLNLYSKYFEY